MIEDENRANVYRKESASKKTDDLEVMPTGSLPVEMTELLDGAVLVPHSYEVLDTLAQGLEVWSDTLVSENSHNYEFEGVKRNRIV